jgi:hypothetical protein
MALPYYLICVAFVGKWSWDWHIHLNYVCDDGFKTILLPLLHWTWVVITLFELRCMLNYLWTLCNMWHVCWIMYDLVCMLAMIWDPSWYSTDYRVYMGSSVCVSMCKRGQLCLILYKLVGSMTPTKTPMTPTPTSTSPHLLPSERGEQEDHIFRLSSL